MKKIIKEKLHSLSDSKYKEFHGGLCPGTNNIIGVRVPILRAYAKELAKQYEIKELLEEIDDEFYEEIMLKGMLIGLSKESFEVVKGYIQNFVPKIDNWAVCDVFCGGLKMTKKYKAEMWEFIQKYLDSDAEFDIRFGVVIILSYYIDEDYIAQDFKVFNSVKSQDYYVKMAVAWAISVCLIKFYDETMVYLRDTAELDKFTYNKAIQKAIESYRINDEQKQCLRKMKRG